MKKNAIKGLTISELEDFAVSIGEQRYRGKQLFDWLYMKEADSFLAMSTFSKSLREKLDGVAEIVSLKVAARQESVQDGTTKILFELVDEKRIESVLIPPSTAFQSGNADNEEQKRLTLCVSTQVGCPLDCKFCATATMGFLRNLTPAEIVDQVMQARRISGKRITNLVFMGMGEPLMNYENVMKSIEIITNGLKITGRRITISTAGWVPKIRQMADERRKVKLAVSLHSLNDEARTSLMPINAKYPLAELLESIQYYYKKTKQRVTFEYILFDNWNDRDEDVRKLVKLSKSIPCKINIIPFHRIDFAEPAGIALQLRPTPLKRAEEFVKMLRDAHVSVFVRSSSGEDIDAACGQLVVKTDQRKNIKRKSSYSSLLVHSA